MLLGSSGLEAREAPQEATADPVASQREGVPLALARLTGPVTLDGVVDEPAWEAVAPVPMTMHSPTFQGRLTERTELRIAYDDRYLYVSGRMWDSEPDQIRTNTLYRDLYSGDDLLGVVIDSYDDYETAVWFVANPAGTRTDRTLSDDGVFGAGGMPMNADWNAHWDLATSQDDEGWYAEFRIPFSTLGFQSVDGRVTMGLVFYRYIPRKNERQTFPAMDPAWGGMAFAKPSRAQRIVLDGVRQSTPLYVTPYSLGGVRQTPSLEGPEEGPRVWEVDSDPTTEVGADLRISPTSNLTLDFTLNTDFAQVEADDQQINLTRFPLFFPEKRQFFQERASTFQFSTGGFNNRLFHSRRIGLDGGEIVRIWGGGRAVGRLGGLDFGVLNMQTAEHDGTPGENMGVFSVSQQVLNPWSSVGGMLTSRLGLNDNVAYGVDASLRLVGDEYLTLKWARSFDEVIDEESALEAGLYQVRWQRQTDEGLSYWAEHNRIGRDYRPGLGFQTRTGTRYVGGRLQYKRFTGGASPFRSVSVQATTGHYHRTADGTAESRSISPEVQVEFKGGTELTFTGNVQYESVLEPFDVADASVEAGDYWFGEGVAKLMLPRNDLFRGDFTLTAGSFFDGTRMGIAVNPTWNQSKHLELQGGYEVNRLEFGDRGLSTTAHLARLKVQVALDTRVSFSALGQYSNVADLTTLNARFRYHFREGTDLWVVYNEGLDMDRAGGLDPRRPLSAGRTLLVKYTHALIW